MSRYLDHKYLELITDLNKFLNSEENSSGYILNMENLFDPASIKLKESPCSMNIDREPILLQPKQRKYLTTYTRKICSFPNCGKSAAYGPKNKTSETCKKHALPNFVNRHYSLCTVSECLKRAVYCEKTHGKLIIKSGKTVNRAIRCIEHKLSTDKKQKGILCRTNGCERMAYYALTHKDRAKFCGDHKPTDYINVRAQLCIFPGCTTQAGYGITQFVRCSKHRLPSDNYLKRAKKSPS